MKVDASMRSGWVRAVASMSCLAVAALAGCSASDDHTGDTKTPAHSEPASPSGPEDPRLQGDPLTEDEVRKELCEQVVAYFPEDMGADASTDSGQAGQVVHECTVENIQFDSQVTVKLHFYVSPLSDEATIEEIDENLLGDSPMCEKVLFSNDAQSKFLRVHAPKSYGERPDEYCGIKFTDEGHMSGEFIENAQNVGVEMWLDPPDSVEQYDVREEIMPYIMNATKEFHND